MSRDNLKDLIVGFRVRESFFLFDDFETGLVQRHMESPFTSVSTAVSRGYPSLVSLCMSMFSVRHGQNVCMYVCLSVLTLLPHILLNILKM
jgi:hypothetical protein